METRQTENTKKVFQNVGQGNRVRLWVLDSAVSQLDKGEEYLSYLLCTALPCFHETQLCNAKQPLSITYFCCFPASNPDYRPEVVIYPYVDFGNQQTYPEIEFVINFLAWSLLLEGFKYFVFPRIFHIAGLNISKQRLLLAHLPFLPASISEREKMSYLSSCISFDSHLMVSQLSTYRPNISVHRSAGGKYELSIMLLCLSLCVGMCEFCMPVRECACPCVCVHACVFVGVHVCVWV